MYESFYKLKKMPFTLLPDPDFFFMSKSHGNAYNHLEHAINETKEFVSIIGQNGSGKTTLINHLLNNIRQDLKVGVINNIQNPVDQIIELVCRQFELDVENKSDMGMLDFFHGFLLKQYEIEQRVILIIDEAQNLSPEAMEEIRVISDLEAEEHHLIQVILVGQPELKYMLRRKDIEKLAHRITLQCQLDAYDMDETEQYIKHRLTVAGAEEPNIFDEESIRAIYEFSKGIPRLINVICDTALIDGFADNMEQISRSVIEEVVKDNEGDVPSVETGLQEILVTEHEENLPPGMAENINRIEGLAESIDKKLDILLMRKDSRDRIVVELNKMLMESLKRHGNTLKQFRSFKEKINQEKKTLPNSQKDAVSPSENSPQNKKKTPSKKPTAIVT